MVELRPLRGRSAAGPRSVGGSRPSWLIGRLDKRPCLVVDAESDKLDVLFATHAWTGCCGQVSSSLDAVFDKGVLDSMRCELRMYLNRREVASPRGRASPYATGGYQHAPRKLSLRDGRLCPMSGGGGRRAEVGQSRPWMSSRISGTGTRRSRVTSPDFAAPGMRPHDSAPACQTVPMAPTFVQLRVVRGR